MTEPILPVEPTSEALLRLDAAAVLKRFCQLERSLVTSCAAWVPAVHRLEGKELLARAAWQNAMTARALRERVFELRYPDRSLAVERDRELVTLFGAAVNAPDAPAFLQALGEVYIPALRRAYEDYLDASDDVADGPTRRFLRLAVAEKVQQQNAFSNAARYERRVDRRGAEDARRWIHALSRALAELGGVSLHEPRSGPTFGDVISPGVAFALPADPARDDRYFRCSFYWPDTLDPGFPYGHGLRLQVRSAVSHLNEVWAVETAGAVLWDLAEPLGWDFVFDAARWLYDESRHMMMGKQRLDRWGLDPAGIPLGSYIYEACRGQDAVVRLGMLAFFETKNIGKKRARAAELSAIGDGTSQRDLDFDWADEAIHTAYGRRWLRRALEVRGGDPEGWPGVVAGCDELVRARVAAATDSERVAIRRCAEQLIARAEGIASRPGGRRASP